MKEVEETMVKIQEVEKLEEDTDTPNRDTPNSNDSM